MISNIHNVGVFPSEEEINKVRCDELSQTTTLSFANVTFYFKSADLAQAFITEAQNALDNRSSISTI